METPRDLYEALQERVGELLAERDSLRTQLAAAQRVPEDAELDALCDELLNDEPGEPLPIRAVDTIAALRRRVAEQRKGLLAVKSLIDESHGVYGLHLNGDTETWDNLLSGGRFEEWLRDFSAAIAKEPQDA